MKLRISGGNVKGNEKLHAFIRQRLATSLSRFRSRIDSVTVRLANVGRPRGELNKSCRVIVTLRPVISLDAEVFDSEFEPAVRRATDRLSRRLREHLLGQRHLDRPTPPQGTDDHEDDTPEGRAT